jgi:hypothetical protein
VVSTQLSKLNGPDWSDILFVILILSKGKKDIAKAGLPLIIVLQKLNQFLIVVYKK